MKIREVKKTVQQAAREEYVLFPDSFLRAEGSDVKFCVENITQWAINMWDSRTDEEVRRDFNLGLHQDAYIAWTFEEFRKYEPTKPR